MHLHPLKIKIWLVLFCSVFSVKSNFDDDHKPWFSSKKLFPTLVFNPMETQVSGIIGVTLPDDQLSYDLFCPVAIGFHKAIYSKGKYSLALNGLIHSQFGWREETLSAYSGYKRSLFNIDFIYGLDFTYRIKDDMFLRFSGAHRSTHLGDDYILLNEVRPSGYWKNDPSNYEYADISLSHKYSIFTFYERIGFVTRLETVRKRLELQAGFQIDDLQKTHWKWLVAGIDLRVLQATNFYPGINAGFGAKLGKKTKILATYYRGFVPYSRLDTTHKTSWLGLGLYFDGVI